MLLIFLNIFSIGFSFFRNPPVLTYKKDNNKDNAPTYMLHSNYTTYYNNDNRRFHEKPFCPT